MKNSYNKAGHPLYRLREHLRFAKHAFRGGLSYASHVYLYEHRHAASTPLPPDTFPKSIGFSLVVYGDGNAEHLSRLIQSVAAQQYPCTELLVIGQQGEPSSFVKYVPALEAARVTGDYVAVLDPDSTLAPEALREVMHTICTTGADVIYTDQDGLKKPDWSPYTWAATHYVGGLMAVRRALWQTCNGAVDDILRNAANVQHIRENLYHRPGQLVYADNRPELSGAPKVSIIILNKDHPADLKRCVDAILTRSSYTNYEIIIVENNSQDPATASYYRQLAAPCRVCRWPGKGFNFSALCNFGVSHSEGSYLLLLNNDTEVISPDWIQELLRFAMQPDVGAVGAWLYYPDDTIQHAGLAIGRQLIAQSHHQGVPKDAVSHHVREVSAVTGACMMIPRHVYECFHGLDEELAVAFNDVDFCMRLRKEGFRIIATPYAELYHAESKTRGPDRSRRFVREQELFMQRWMREMLAGDPYPVFDE